jgi:hypothetical protein
MFYKPKYCSECASELNKCDESYWLVSRFCEVCKPHFKAIEIFTKFGGIAFGAIATIFGVGVWLQKPVVQPLNLAKTEIASVAPAPKPLQKIENNQPKSNVQPKVVEVNQPVAVSSKQSVTPQTQPAFDKKTPQTAAEVSQSAAIETVYMCGAKTKKGTPCSRKVKGNVRCWQHTGQEAMMSAKELRIQ